MDLYITFNKESGFYETINNCEIEYIISIENKNISTIKFTECIDGQICNTSVYSLNYDNHTSKITVPLNTLKLYFLMCNEHAAGGDYDGLIIYVAPSLEKILEHATTYYEASHNITSPNEPNQCELGLCNGDGNSICLKYMLDNLQNNGKYDLECTELELSELHLYCVPL